MVIRFLDNIYGNWHECKFSDKGIYAINVHKIHMLFSCHIIKHLNTINTWLLLWVKLGFSG